MTAYRTRGPAARPTGARTRSLSHSVPAALGTVLVASAAPYGYTVSIWSSGAIVMGAHGSPRVAEVFAFGAGALAAFTLLGALGRTVLDRGPQLVEEGHRLRAGLLHWFSVGAAVGTSALVAEIGGWVAWPLASFSATLLYLVAASVQLGAVAARRG